MVKSRASGTFLYRLFTHFYKALLMSIVEYSSHAWGLREYKCLEHIQTNLLRAFLGLGRTAPITGLSGEMNWRPLHWLTKSIIFKYWYHINNLPNTLLPTTTSF